MDIILNRQKYTLKSTIGEIAIDGRHICFTLEDRSPNVKIPKETAIPAGRYRLVIDHSPKYDKDMPHILDVPGFTGIRIHSGNTPEHTEGCVLVGLSRGVDMIMESRMAFSRFMLILEDAVKRGEVWVEIKDSEKEVIL